MELDCFTCNQPISVDLLDWERLAAECPNCQNWNAYSALYLEALSHIYDSYHLNELYFNFLKRLIINRSPISVLIEIPSHRIQTASERVSNNVGKLLSALLILGSIVTVLFAERWASTIYSGAVIALTLVSGLLGVFLGIVILRSDATYVVKLDNAVLERYLRLPFGLKTQRHSKNILSFKQFYVRETSLNGKRGTYRLIGIERYSGQREEILRGSEALMLLVESELEKLLKITDAPVSGSIANPYQKTVSADMIPRWVTGIRIYERESPVEESSNSVPISIVDHIHLEDKAFNLTYADESFIDYIRRVKVQQSDEICLVQSSPNRFVYRGFRLFRGLMGLIALVVSVIYFIDYFTYFNNSYLYGFGVLMIGLLLSPFMLDWLINKQIILIDREKMYRSARPYPILFRQGKIQKVNHFKQFYVRPQAGLRRLKGSHQLIGIDHTNQHFRVCEGSGPFMLVLEAELERFLNLRDIAIGGSLSNPHQSAIE